jgi:hypothetical protein
MASYHNTDEAAQQLIATMLENNYSLPQALAAARSDLGLSKRGAEAAARAHYRAIGADCDATGDAIAASGGGTRRGPWSVASSSGAKSADPTCGTGEDLEEFTEELAGL